MHWNIEIAAEATTIIQRVDHLPSGIVSCFVSLSGGVGLKLYPTEKLRDFSRNKQIQVAALDLAPAVGDAFTLPDDLHNAPALQWVSPFKEVYPSGPLIYGYISQTADTTTPIPKDDKKMVVNELKSHLELETPDDLEEQDDNYGILDGRVVLLDFDIGSWN